MAGGTDVGGFGGGAGGSPAVIIENNSVLVPGGGGGGGGYSGGGGRAIGVGGGGGGSFLDPSATFTTLVGGENTGDGEVTVTLVSAPVPEPGSLALMSGGFAVLAFVRRRRVAPRTAGE